MSKHYYLKNRDVEETVTPGTFGDEGPVNGALLRCGCHTGELGVGDWRCVRTGTSNPNGWIQGHGREKVAWFDPLLPSSDSWEDAWLALDAIAGVYNGNEDLKEYRLSWSTTENGDDVTLSLYFCRDDRDGVVFLETVEVDTESSADHQYTLQFLKMAANRTEAILAWIEGVAARVASKAEAVHV